jgi:hypothetical protein
MILYHITTRKNYHSIIHDKAIIPIKGIVEKIAGRRKSIEDKLDEMERRLFGENSR